MPTSCRSVPKSTTFARSTRRGLTRTSRWWTRRSRTSPTRAAAARTASSATLEAVDELPAQRLVADELDGLDRPALVKREQEIGRGAAHRDIALRVRAVDGSVRMDEPLARRVRAMD